MYPGWERAGGLGWDGPPHFAKNLLKKTSMFVTISHKNSMFCTKIRASPLFPKFYINMNRLEIDFILLGKYFFYQLRYISRY